MRSPWKQMTPERRLAAATAFWNDPDLAEPHAEAVGLIARQLNFRVRTAAALDPQKKARYIAGMPNLPDAIAARVLVTYHLASHRPMLAAFLDALGIAHEDGIITAEQVPPPDPAKLRGAVSALRERFPAEDVTLYLSTLAWQDPETWNGLDETVVVNRQ